MGIIKTKDRELQLIRKIISAGCKEIIDSQNISKYLTEINGYSKELYEHSINVGILSLIVGINSCDNKKYLLELFTSALLHDYGKLNIPKRILEKRDVLTKSERSEMEKHPSCGYQFLKQDNKLSREVLLGILDHHERVDGRGYGNGKCEEEISKLAKTIMIADVYDAMISDRVYRKRIGRGIVYEYLFKCAGTELCRSEVRCFINNTISLELDYVIREVRNYMLNSYADNKINSVR